MKLLQDNKKLHAEEFSNTSPYVIMFGPDKCGATNKVSRFLKHIFETANVYPRCTLSSSTRTPKLESMRRNTLGPLQWPALKRKHLYIL